MRYTSRYHYRVRVFCANALNRQAEENGVMKDSTGRQARIEALRKEIQELTARWPQHSVPPAMLAHLEELEEELDELEREERRPIPPPDVRP